MGRSDPLRTILTASLFLFHATIIFMISNLIFISHFFLKHFFQILNHLVLPIRDIPTKFIIISKLLNKDLSLLICISFLKFPSRHLRRCELMGVAVSSISDSLWGVWGLKCWLWLLYTPFLFFLMRRWRVQMLITARFIFYLWVTSIPFQPNRITSNFFKLFKAIFQEIKLSFLFFDILQAILATGSIIIWVCDYTFRFCVWLVLFLGFILAFVGD